ncbi:hypothetical protein [Amycolatopsis sp. NPDC051716]|uniref:hypothetical protein n=1 Tax=Amycolatopsis sp. NPDC051716 TaxID=3155804 RepID=UPI0034411C9D
MTLPLVGVCLLTLGFAADQFGWWTTRPFLTNLVSGVTSACFGIPFALLFLASFTAHQAEQLERSNAQSLFDGALAAFAGWVRRVTSSRSHDRLDIALDSLTTQVLDRLEQVTDVREGASPDIPALVDALSTMHEFLTHNFSFLVDMEEHWASTCAQWRFLDDYVKPRMYEQQLSWIRADAAARLDTILRGEANPFLPVIPMREHLLPLAIEATARLVENDVEDLSPAVEQQLHQLRDAIFSLRGNLPRSMRLREALAIACGQQFEIGLAPGRGLRL